MPWRRKDYPPDWEAIRARVRARARDACEGCGVPNHAFGYWVEEGFRTVNAGSAGECPPFTTGHRVVQVVCTVAHVEHDLSDNRDEVLRFWCQRCHNRHDAAYRARHAAETRRRKKEA